MNLPLFSGVGNGAPMRNMTSLNNSSSMGLSPTFLSAWRTPAMSGGFFGSSTVPTRCVSTCNVSNRVAVFVSTQPGVGDATAYA
jgi:hypothetical protein